MFGSRRPGWRWGEWMIRGFGLGFTNPGGTGRVLDVCRCYGGACREWVGDLDQGLEGWGGVMSV